MTEITERPQSFFGIPDRLIRIPGYAIVSAKDDFLRATTGRNEFIVAQSETEWVLYPVVKGEGRGTQIDDANPIIIPKSLP